MCLVVGLDQRARNISSMPVNKNDTTSGMSKEELRHMIVEYERVTEELAQLGKRIQHIRNNFQKHVDIKDMEETLRRLTHLPE